MSFEPFEPFEPGIQEGSGFKTPYIRGLNLNPEPSPETTERVLNPWGQNELAN